MNLEDFMITQGGMFLGFAVLIALALLFFNAVVRK
ncbi:hypothetical protein J2S03_002825 [Alicyclobacillus cycloheptanicus]|uniref:Oxaloacetate decarboxylase n=1 Tax=Alicyclobacillus cycloheptanicus TaxID=1457 RepID=A0ABT9XKX9_9BACL|nr:hypothetical protein [Alicyclobacillus cycloheptanicus]